MSRKSKKRAKQAVPEEILAEGSGPNEAVAADAQALADAAADALASAEIAEVEAEVEAVAMAAEVVVVAAEAARAEAREAKKDKKAKKKGKKSEPAAAAEVALDAWGQPIIVEPEEANAADDEEAPAEPSSAESGEAAAELDASSESDLDASSESDLAASGETELEASDDSDLSASGESELEASADAESAAADDVATDDASSDDEMAAEMAADDSGDDLEATGDEGGEGDADGVMPTSAATMDATQLKHLVEALVFAADKPVTIQRLRQLTRVADITRLETALAELAEDFKARGIALQVVSGGYQFRTNTTYSGWVQQLIAGRPVRLSRAQLETLAICAYRQPITRPEIDEIRGVDSSSTLKVLLDRSLIRILGKREEAGRPVLYGTTKEFLDFFSLGDLRELPTLREYSELTAESRKVVSDRLGVSLDGTPLADAASDAEGGGDEAEAIAEPPEPTMDDALRAYVDDPSVEAAAAEPTLDAADASGEPSVEASSKSDADEPSTELASESHTDEPSAELSSESHTDEPSAELASEPHTDEPSAELASEPHTDEPGAELAVQADDDGSGTELSVESPVEEPAVELTADAHIEEPAVELSGDAAEHESAEVVESHVDEPSAELSAEPHVDEGADLSADAHVGADDAGNQPTAEHDFIDPDELAGRVVAGESDVHASGSDESAVHVLESAAAEDAESTHAEAAHGDPGEHSDGDSDAADASAHDDPAVD